MLKDGHCLHGTACAEEQWVVVVQVERHIACLSAGGEKCLRPEFVDGRMEGGRD